MTSGDSANAGRRVGPYRLVEPLGRGGMGEVWLAHDATGAAGGAPRLVALKLLDPELAAGAAVRTRFAREVAALRRVDSRFVAPLLDADTAAAVPWLASAYVAGPTLADHVARHGALADRPLRALAQALVEALVAIHAAGVVHRDLTPRNVVLGPDGPRVVDFGIAWYPGAVPVTQAGSAVGTPTWMAPERLMGAGGDATPASDVWSWGAIMAYAGGGGSRPLPAWLEPVVRATTAPDPGARPTATRLRTMLAPTVGADATDPGSDVTVPLPGADGPPRGPAATVGRDGADRTQVFTAGDGRHRGRRLVSWVSGAGVVAAAAVAGAVTELLAAVLAAAVLFLVALALRFRRTQAAIGTRPPPAVPPTWSVALAVPVILGATLVGSFGPLPGAVAVAVLVVVFLIVAGDLVA